MKSKCVVAIAGLLLLSACGREPGVYPLSVADAHAMLKDNPLTEFRRNRQCGVVIKILPHVSGANEVTWYVTSSDTTMLTFKAQLTPVSSSESKVDVHVQKDFDGNELYSGDYDTPFPVVDQPVRPAIEEAIAAILERRPFDAGKAPKAIHGDRCDLQKYYLEKGRRMTVHDDPYN